LLLFNSSIELFLLLKLFEQFFVVVVVVCILYSYSQWEISFLFHSIKAMRACSFWRSYILSFYLNILSVLAELLYCLINHQSTIFANVLFCPALSLFSHIVGKPLPYFDYWLCWHDSNFQAFRFLGRKQHCISTVEKMHCSFSLHHIWGLGVVLVLWFV
jgi:hypothetical protein